MRSPKDFFRPLAVGAPEPVREIPFRPSRMIHFFPASNPKMVAKVPDMATKVDILLANLEDGVPAADKEAARAGLVEVGKAWDPSVRHPAVDPGQQPRLAVGARRPDRRGHRDRRPARRHHDPEGRGARGHPLRRPPARPARGPAPGSTRPLLVHAILETARGVANVEEICAASPRMQGLSLGPGRPGRQPPHEDHPGRRRPPRLPGAPGPARRRHRGRPRASTSRTCGTTRSPAWSTPASPTASCRSTGPSATSRTRSPARTSSATPSCSAASGRGACTRCRSTSPAGVLAATRPTWPTPAGSSRRWATAPAPSCSTGRWRTTPRSSSAG